MRQLLILGFYCEVYRREPRCRVYANDVLLDEFDIPHTARKESNSVSFNVLNPLDKKNQRESDYKDLKTHPPFLKYIEFDDGDTDTLSLKIKIQNDDNNYNNGFMTKFTHISLPYVYLSSKKSMENIDYIRKNFKYTRPNWEKYSNILNYYSGSRPQLFDNLIFFAKVNFSNVQIDNFNSSHFHDISQYILGSTGDFHLTLQKKLDFWKSAKNDHKGFWILGYHKIIEYFYNKYKQYENQRSANT